MAYAILFSILWDTNEIVTDWKRHLMIPYEFYCMYIHFVNSQLDASRLNVQLRLS